MTLFYDDYNLWCSKHFDSKVTNMLVDNKLVHNNTFRIKPGHHTFLIQVVVWHYGVVSDSYGRDSCEKVSAQASPGVEYEGDVVPDRIYLIRTGAHGQGKDAAYPTSMEVYKKSVMK
jgi:hypothetical protein